MVVVVVSSPRVLSRKGWSLGEAAAALSLLPFRASDAPHQSYSTRPSSETAIDQRTMELGSARDMCPKSGRTPQLYVESRDSTDGP